MEHKPKVTEKKHLDILLGFIPPAHSFKLLVLYYSFQGGQALTGWRFWGHKTGEKVDLWRVTLLCPGICSVTMNTGCGRWVGGGWTWRVPERGLWHCIHGEKSSALSPSPPQNWLSCRAVPDIERHVVQASAFPTNCPALILQSSPLQTSHHLQAPGGKSDDQEGSWQLQLQLQTCHWYTQCWIWSYHIHN